MRQPRHWRAGQLALACLGLAVALDHVPQRYQVQRMQHLVPPLPLTLHSDTISDTRMVSHCASSESLLSQLQ